MKISESIVEIAKAFSSFQSEVSNPNKNATNPHFKSKYSTLDEIINVVRPTLTKYGLSFLQTTKTENEAVGVSTILLHSSGEFIQSDFIWVPLGKNNAHGVGSSVTYGRRFSLSSMLGIATDDDLDGNDAINEQPKAAYSGNTSNNNSGSYGGNKTISEKQLKLVNKLIEDLSKQSGHDRETIKNSLRAKQDVGSFESTKTLTIGQASKVIGYLQEWLNK